MSIHTSLLWKKFPASPAVNWTWKGRKSERWKESKQAPTIRWILGQQDDPRLRNLLIHD
jgi:hypothetical protein